MIRSQITAAQKTWNMHMYLWKAGRRGYIEVESEEGLERIAFGDAYPPPWSWNAIREYFCDLTGGHWWKNRQGARQPEKFDIFAGQAYQECVKCHTVWRPFPDEEADESKPG